MAGVASFIYDKAPGILPVLLFLFISFYFIGPGYSHVFVPVVFTRGLFLGETSGTTEIPEEVMEVSASILKVTMVEGEMGSSIPVLML